LALFANYHATENGFVAAAQRGKPLRAGLWLLHGALG
jgi:hypothetical protein